MLIVIVLWIFYFVIHSLLATNKIKELMYEKFPLSKKYYRITYNLIAVITLIPIAILTYKLISSSLDFANILTLFGIILLMVGIVLLLVSFSAFNLKEFIGIEQMNGIENNGKLFISGMYKYVRHPLYFSIIVIFIGILFIFPNYKTLILNLIINIYLIIGSKLEEKKLISHFGQSYIDYQQKVKGLIPFLY